MSKVKIRPYCSPTLVLLAFDWPDGDRRDFLGFAIQRSPGYRKPDGTEETESWLPNRVGFDGPEQGRDFPSDTCPIQKFQWWDARIDDPDRGESSPTASGRWWGRRRASTGSPRRRGG